jgi:hypothetical protein
MEKQVVASTTSTTSTRTAELQAKIEKQVADQIATVRAELEAARISEARSRFLLDAVRGKGSGGIN